MQPSPETASHNLGGSTHWYSSIQSSSMYTVIHIMILTKSINMVRKVKESVTLSLRLVFGILAYDDLFDKERKINITAICIQSN